MKKKPFIAEDVWNGLDRAGMTMLKAAQDIFVPAALAVVVIANPDEEGSILVKCLDYNISNARKAFRINIAKEIKNHLLNPELKAITKEDIGKDDR